MTTRWPLLLLGTVLLLCGNYACGGPVTVQVHDGTTYASPQEAGVIDVEDGTEFEFYSTVGGLSAVVRFQVPRDRTHEVEYRGRDVFDIAIRLSQTTAAVVEPQHEAWVQASFSANTDYFLEIEQRDGAMMGPSLVTIRTK